MFILFLYYLNITFILGTHGLLPDWFGYGAGELRV